MIIPGTKSSISDLYWLRQSGFEAQIKKLHSNGTIIFGVCGGYQILGEKITDPSGIEGGGDEIGFNLLPISTVFMTEKITEQVCGKIQNLDGTLEKLNGLSYKGYEIHMGVSGENLAVISKNDVYGTYVHGIFDESNIAPVIIDCLCEKKGIEKQNLELFDIEKYKDEQYDKLADIVRKSLDMDKIYCILGV